MAKAARPLIFISPYSESIAKLRSVCVQIAQDENIEIIDIENNQELHQVMANYGPSLMLYGHPKKCAMGLQLHYKIIKKVQAKTVLITEKVIPYKTLDKFMKLGLTDCITEPIAPKSLLYKIKLLIRSLPDLSAQEADYRTITSNDSAAKPEKDLALTNSKEENNPKNDHLKQKLTTDTDMVPADEKTIKEKRNASEVIETNYRGDLKENTSPSKKENAEIDKGKSVSKIDKYYKGETAASSECQDSNMIGESSIDDVSEKEIEKLKRSFALDVESESMTKDAQTEIIDGPVISKSKRSTLQLDQSDDTDTTEEKDREKIERYLKSKQKRLMTIDIEDDIPDKEKRPLVQASKAFTVAKKPLHLEIEEASENYLTQRKKELKAKREIERFQGLEVDQTEAKSDDQAESPEAAEQFSESKKAKQELLVEEDLEKQTKKENRSPERPENFSKKKKLVRTEHEPARKMEHDASAEDENGSEDEDIEAASELPTAPEKKLPPEYDIEKLKRLKKAREERADLAKKKRETLLAVDQTEEKSPMKPSPEAKGVQGKTKEKTQLAVEEDKASRFKKALPHRPNEVKKAKPETSPTEEAQKDMHGPHQQADYIEKYYNQKKIERPTMEQNWDGLANRNKTQIVAPQPKPSGEKSLIITKEDLGEQTIDYSKIKEEFEILDKAIAQGKTSYEIHDESNAVKEQQPLHGGHSATNKNAVNEFGTLTIAEISEEGAIETIYYPDSKGIEHAIRILHLYSNKETNDLDILTYLGKTINNQLKGRISFLSKEKKSDRYVELFNGHLHFCPFQEENTEINTAESITSLQVTSGERWKAYKHQHLPQWAQARLPSWSDETFQKENLTYIYPYYDGSECMGFSIIDFEGKFDRSQVTLVEILCESARSIYLYNYHLAGKRGQHQGKLLVPENDQQSGMLGRFKGLFGKKAG